MADVKALKKKLIETLYDSLENPGEEGVDPRVLTVASKVVKDFADEAEDRDAESTAKIASVQKYIAKRRGEDKAPTH